MNSKDLSKIGRDLSKTLLVDNVPENFALQPDNGIEIKSWFSDPYDRELLDMIPLLKSTPIVVFTTNPFCRYCVRWIRRCP